MHVEIVETYEEGSSGRFPIWRVLRDGNFIIGAQTAAAARERLNRLEANQWKYLECYGQDYPNPLDWIKRVREEGWTFEAHSVIELGKDGRGFFAGNVVEYSAAFRYLILDDAVLQRVVHAAPDVAKEGFPALNGCAQLEA